MKSTRAWLLLSMIVAAGCASAEPVESASAELRGSSTSTSTPIIVPLSAKSGSSLTGTAVLTEEPSGGVRVVIDVAGIAPGEHGAHVHQNGDCSSPDAMSAGDHFTPQRHPHGLPPTEPRHIGDFGNLVVGEDGRGRLEIVAPHASLRADDPCSFVDRAIVIHAHRDDGGQPSGNAGARVGCGVIRSADYGAGGFTRVLARNASSVR
ncbi:MAG: superoxide dismutase family protein [Labilithrix sp.]|nr:superoxide dismutase family protein [Labilithrix sp.]